MKIAKYLLIVPFIIGIISGFLPIPFSAILFMVGFLAIIFTAYSAILRKKGIMGFFSYSTAGIELNDKEKIAFKCGLVLIVSIFASWFIKIVIIELIT